MTISFNLAPGYALGAAVDAIRQIEDESHLPASIVSGFQGAAQVFQDSLKGQGVLVLAAVFAAFVILGILYESFIHPITIISGLPSAGVGALLVLIAFRMDLTVIAMIGIVMLVGIVKKNVHLLRTGRQAEQIIAGTANEGAAVGHGVRVEPPAVEGGQDVAIDGSSAPVLPVFNERRRRNAKRLKSPMIATTT